MPLKMKAALITLVVGTCFADLAVIVAYHMWWLPILSGLLSVGGALALIYVFAHHFLREGEQRQAEAAEKARRVRA